ncbi:hypothetical protein NDU88_003695 [Pleurodeles waltl]|uniref:Endonuclease/exonuclease/phosphatase domain-containing protein n=1 Tax=Pleurodeles waltl TaxID=8319 RepID=A0AAV7PAC7_PLEWA|nr:hypothetical protein NDU88_003695 [Pleurodeles waltl]
MLLFALPPERQPSGRSVFVSLTDGRYGTERLEVSGSGSCEVRRIAHTGAEAHPLSRGCWDLCRGPPGRPGSSPPVLHSVLSGFVRAVEGLRSPLPGTAGAAPEVCLHCVACRDLPRSIPSQRPAPRVTARLSDLTTLHPRPRTYLPLTYFTLMSSAGGVCFNVYAHPRKHQKALLFEQLLQKVEEIRCVNPTWDILVTGDFNTNLTYTPEPDDQLAAEKRYGQCCRRFHWYRQD